MSSSSDSSSGSDSSTLSITTRSQRNPARTAVKRQIALCNLHISDLHFALKEARAKRTELNAALNATTPFLAKLSLEVICEIFQHVVDARDPRDFACTPPQFVIGRVCSAWRTISRSSPTLWRTVVIRFDNRRTRQPKLLEEWLKRAGQAGPLRFYLSIATPKGVWNTAPLECSTMVLKLMHRWEVFECTEFLAMAWHSPGPMSFPRLKALSLRYEPFDYNYLLAPQLRSVTVYGSQPQRLRLCWDQLETVKLHSVHVREARWVVRQMVQAREVLLDVHCEGPLPPSIVLDPAGAQKRLPHLLTLEIRDDAGRSLSGILLDIVVPALQTLTIVTRGQNQAGGTEWCADLVDMYRRSITTGESMLTTLTLKQCALREIEVIQLLHCLPSLTSLDLHHAISGGGMSDDLIDQLNPSNDHPGVCILPFLRRLNYSGPVKFDADNALFMLSERLTWGDNRAKYKALFNKEAPVVQKIEEMRVEYQNREYFREGEFSNPNGVGAFYERKVELKTKGVNFDMVWVESTRT
ncbi:hypothetical protein JR316_0013050 [Psilocybe cubensis]|uniref:F-box domain-containing protein n=2 Tax=Psilocybe cubensis TaxID=181762 RepID=A0A8H7XQ25_PSICU|nr:hypothetical protein JR316_0013050 [Psilocybe cubensis]KAH9474588.1 hypothetical protein JR316_0013050 [Psilocybe cubensis]